MTIVDAHNHPGWHGMDFDRLIGNMDENGIDRTWLLSWECPWDEYDHEFDDVLPASGSNDGAGPIPYGLCREYAMRVPDRFVLGYAPDPREAGAVEKLQEAVEVYGVRVCGELKLRMMSDSPEAIAMFNYCGDKGLPVVMHFDYDISATAGSSKRGYWYGGGIEVLRNVLNECPGTNFIGHAPGFWAHISNDGQHCRNMYPEGEVIPGGKLPMMLREFRNLYCDMSARSGLQALSRDCAFARDFLMEFSDRVLFGRDIFDDSHRRLVEELCLPDEVREKIFHLNAESLTGSAFENNAAEPLTSIQDLL